MAKVLYTAEASVKGGRLPDTAGRLTARSRSTCGFPRRWEAREAARIPSSSSPSASPPASRAPWRSSPGARSSRPGDAVIDSKVSLLPNDARGFDLAVELDVTLPSIDDPAAAAEAVRAAHKVCPYSNATRGNIDVTLTANGQPV